MLEHLSHKPETLLFFKELSIKYPRNLEITEALAKGDRVELRGFGAFSVKSRDARIGRNPRTGESVKVESKAVPFFKTGKLLRDRLNGRA